ncbi:MAG TPA: VWA domain-containing protein, partial [Burkholderiales bacterium]|nr:VWA domain-containing protein [Burkholderiales bacterium]
MSIGFDFARPWVLVLLPLALLPLLRRRRDTLAFSYVAWLPVDRAGRALGFL